MGATSDLQRSIHQLLKHNRDGSYATQADKRYVLLAFAKDLVGLQYKLRDIRNLKSKHIAAVVNYWKGQGLSNATLKNRTTTLRYLAEKIHKRNIVPTNGALTIGARKYVSTVSRGLHNPNFDKISNEHVRISLELQRVFGLRREEAIKIRPWHADLGDRLKLQPSWCKGGRGREVPIRTDEQRHWLQHAKQLAKEKKSSLIPKDKSYIQQRYVYAKQTSRAGLKNLHGLRHAYAQQRYKELTGLDAPINGGLASKQLTPEQKQKDYEARMIITAELGHGRISIVAAYCGK